MMSQAGAGGREWHFVTGEYPPQIGGVADYTYQVAAAIAAAGHDVHVWCPAAPGARPAAPGVTVHDSLGEFRLRDLARTDRALGRHPGPRRILMQWVPHAFGWRGMNLAVCLWLLKRARANGDRVEVMVHEPYLPFSRRRLRINVGAFVQRLMTATVLLAARRVWVSVPWWTSRLRPWAAGRRLGFGWLPVMSNVPVVLDPAAITATRAGYAVGPSGLLVGHFGTYGEYARETLDRVLPEILAGAADASALLLGPGSESVRDDIVRAHPALATRVHATGRLEARALSLHISACDLFLQPYLDGASTRRSSLMATLAHGRAVVATRGPATEALWGEDGAVALADFDRPDELARETLGLLRDAGRREALGRRAAAVYGRRFDVARTADALLGESGDESTR